MRSLGDSLGPGVVQMCLLYSKVGSSGILYWSVLSVA